MNAKQLTCSSFALCCIVACNNLTEVPEIPQASLSSSSLNVSSSSALSSSSTSPLVSSSSTALQFSTLTDSRDGKIYKTVFVNGKEWTVDNMSFKPAGSKGAVCPNNISNCDSTGYLYDWNTATGGDSSNTLPSGIQGICPNGWHVPSDAEFTVLRMAAGDSIVAGFNLKAKDGWGNGVGSDLLGFGAKPIGYRDVDSAFYGVGSYAYFWSTSQVNVNESNIWYIGKNNKALFEQPNYKEVMASVRCMRNY